MELVVQSDGAVRCVYDEAINLAALGRVQITRGSHVEPDDDGRWFADMAVVDGPRLGPCGLRSDALKAEVVWLSENWLQSDSGDSYRSRCVPVARLTRNDAVWESGLCGCNSTESNRRSWLSRPVRQFSS
jgi:hypothetical protein